MDDGPDMGLDGPGYTRERSVGKTAKSAVRDRGALNHLLPMFGRLVLADVTPKLLAAYKTRRRLEEAAPRIRPSAAVPRHG
jgi:hypothetical protein